MVKSQIWVEPEHRLEYSNLHGDSKGFSIRRQKLPKKLFGMYSRHGLLERLGKELVSGKSTRNVSKEYGIAYSTATKLYNILKIARGKIYCKCGQEVNHINRCHINSVKGVRVFFNNKDFFFYEILCNDILSGNLNTSDELILLEYFNKIRWAEIGLHCPHCGCSKVYTTNRGYKCGNPDCYSKFTDFTKTIFENSKVKLWQWVFVLSEIMKSPLFPTTKLAVIMGITQKSAWHIKYKIIQVLKKVYGDL